MQAVATPCGRVGALICWENYMPLARSVLYAQGEEIHIAPTYDEGERWVASMQHIAREGGCWVVGNGGCALRGRDVPSSAWAWRAAASTSPATTVGPTSSGCRWTRGRSLR